MSETFQPTNAQGAVLEILLDLVKRITDEEAGLTERPDPLEAMRLRMGRGA